MIIALDGPAGSGKSNMSKLLAKRIGATYIDTGATYRCAAFLAMTHGVEMDDEQAVLSLLKQNPISFGWDEDGNHHVLLGGRDVTSEIRTPEVDGCVSDVSKMPAIRACLVEQQRALAEGSDVVIEGRDVTTVVFPNAELKIFLTARPEVRARRRALQNLQRSGHDASLLTESMVMDELASMRRRDEKDSTRECSPLTEAADAVHLDNSDLDVEGTLQRMLELVDEARARKE